MSVTETPSLGSMPPVKLLFQQCVDWLVAQLPAQRAVLLFGDDPRGELTVRAAHGLGLEGFWQNAPLSLNVLRDVRDRGEPLLLANVAEAPQYADSLSLLLNDVRSLLCVPFWGPDGSLNGLLYADCVTAGQALAREQLDRTLKIARALEQQLRAAVRGEALPASPFRELNVVAVRRPEPRRDATAPATPPAEDYAGRRAVKLSIPSLKARALFFRSLATAFAAGLPLHDSLGLLGRQAEDRRMGAVAWELSRRVQRGQSLSEAMIATGVFTPFQIQMVATGQRSGQLDAVLSRVADFEEKSRHDRMRVQSALVYPTFVLLVSLVLLVVAPTWLMGHQFQLLRDLGLSIPWLSQALWVTSRALVSPLGLALLALLYAQRRQLLRLPVFRKILHRAAVLHFARVLALQLQAGISVVEALPQAAAVVADRELNAVVPAARQALLDGVPLAEALRATGWFPRAFCDMLMIADEIGRVPDLMRWLAGFYEMELEAAFNGFVAMMEPVVMMVLGIAAGVVMLGTLLPVVKALQAF